MRECPNPGFYPGTPFETYGAWDALNFSTMNELRRTPAHCYHTLHSGGRESTAALERGHLFHMAALEPERYKAEVVVPPKFDKRYKEQKAKWAEWQAAHPESEWTYAKVEEDAEAKLMAASVLEHETAGLFFSGDGYNELAIVWDDKEHGIRCKALIDRVSAINEWPIAGDLKSSRDASRQPFEKSCAKYGYHVQAAHYLAGLEALSPIPAGAPFRRFIHFVVESAPPYLTAVYELDDAALDEGRLRRDRYMRKWAECTNSGIWPGYPAGIEYISLPAWAFKEWVDE